MNNGDFNQFPNNPQSYNRYSYVMNNPLRYVDPSGYEMSEWQMAVLIYMHTQSWQRYMNECGITGMMIFAYGMGVGGPAWMHMLHSALSSQQRWLETIDGAMGRQMQKNWKMWDVGVEVGMEIQEGDQNQSELFILELL